MLIRRIRREIVRHITIAAEDHSIFPLAKLRISGLAPRSVPAIFEAVDLACSALRISIAASARKSPSSVRLKGRTAK